MGILADSNPAYRFITDYCTDNGLWASFDSVSAFLKDVMKKKEPNSDSHFMALTDTQVQECCRLVSALNHIKKDFEDLKG